MLFVAIFVFSQNRTEHLFRLKERKRKKYSATTFCLLQLLATTIDDDDGGGGGVRWEFDAAVHNLQTTLKK